MLRQVYKFLSSLNLALVLLAVIIFATAQGTYLESTFSAEVARKYIYNAWWFNIWLCMLCLNLFCVASIRYPWKPHQTGFVITHAGIITLLIGGMIDRNWGIEGYIELNRGEAPSNLMQLHKQELQVFMPGNSEPAITECNLKEFITPADFQFPVKTPSPNVKVEVLDMYPQALQLTLQGPTMGRHEQWLFLGEREDMGPAVLKFVNGEPPKAKMVPRLERYFVFSKFDTPICKTLNGTPTGATAHLVLNDKSAPELQLSLMGKEFKISVKEHLKAGMPLEGLTDWRLYIIGYYPDFKMAKDGPQNVSEEPNNPALMFELNGPPMLSSEVTDAEESNPHEAPGTIAPGANALSIYLCDDGKLRYIVKSRTKGESRGEIEMGKPVALGWAGADFVAEKLVSGELSNLMQSGDHPVSFPESRLESLPPGLLCRVSVGAEKKVVWVPQTPLHVTDDQKIEVTREPVEVGGQKVELALCSSFVRLPFKLALKKFNAPLQEGSTEGSDSFTAFESTLAFEGENDTVRLKPDAKLSIPSELIGLEKTPNGTVLHGAITEQTETSLTMDFDDRQRVVIPIADVANVDKQTQKIHMNHPTTYPQTWWGTYLGTDYKFSQAGHDLPRRPDYSSVQVLRDPGWMPKWVGCLMICFGIFTMFYLKPYFKRSPAVAIATVTGEPKLATVRPSDLKKTRKQEKANKEAGIVPAVLNANRQRIGLSEDKT